MDLRTAESMTEDQPAELVEQLAHIGKGLDDAFEDLLQISRGPSIRRSSPRAVSAPPCAPWPGVPPCPWSWIWSCRGPASRNRSRWPSTT
ncbi:hypothetical protein [Streptomyces sp. ActVer]|uniref:hypothetical protein n=1 Tax=Streptomyces sp. ActVer TaxID=3014558 RepID=UPI002F96B568